jgi:hypothetical protein
MSDVKKCQGCFEVEHLKTQYACDKCMTLGDLHNGLAVIITAIKQLEERWVNK